MEKLAIVELSTTNLTLTLANVIKNKSFLVYDKIETPIDLKDGFEEDKIIKSIVTKEITSVLETYKKIIAKEGIKDIIAIATNFILQATNQGGFINEINNALSTDFKVLSDEEEAGYVYTAAINTLNKPKGLIVNLGEFTTQIVLYNRRNVVNTEIIPFGTINLPKQIEADENTDNEELSNKMKEFFANQIKDFDFMSELEEDFDVIGFGQSFLALGEISRRISKYPIANAHNYSINEEKFDKVFDVIKPIDFSKNSKIKGISLDATKNLLPGLSIISAVFDKVNKDEIFTSNKTKVDGLLLNTVLPITLEKPISDNLGYSLQVLTEFYDKAPNNSEHVYNLSMILFKQLRVLHKLNRSFVKVLRTASYLSASGKRVDFDNSVKASFDIILNSDIYGLSHAELVLAGFAALYRDSDNFNLPEWVKYRDILTEEDLDAVRKLAVIIKVAESLDITGFGNVTDVDCDILGDSVIMKTIVNEPSELEIKSAMLVSADFKKVFGKNLEIL